MMRSRFATALVAAWLLSSGCGKDPEVAKREYVKSGDAYAAQYKYREATLEYRNALALDPRFGEARSKLAAAYTKLGDAKGAYREYIRAADLLPADATAQLRAGEMLLLAHKYEDARARADQALALQPGNVEAHVLKGNSLAGLQNLDAAVAEVEAAVAADPDRPATHARLGYLELAKGDQAQAERAFKRAVDVAPRAAGPRIALANFYMATGDTAAAEQALHEAIALSPRDRLANQLLARFYAVTGRLADAEQPLKTVAELATDGSGRLQLADYYVAMHREGDARAILEAVARSASPARSAAQLRLAQMAVANTDRAGAYRLLGDVLAREPENPEALAALAELQIGDQKLDEALANAQAAVKAKPRDARFQFVLGRVRAARHDDSEAMAAFSEALRLDPRYQPAELELARMYLATRQIPQAIQLASSALTHAPKSADARLVLARGYLMAGDPSSAERYVRELGRTAPESVPVLIVTGQLEATKGNVAAARSAFEHALRINPRQPEAIEWLMRLDASAGNAAAARERLAAALARAPRDPALRMIAAQFYYSAGDYPRAEEALKAVIAADPSSLQAYGRLGQVYAKENRLADAVAEFDRAARDHPRDVAMATAAAVIVQMQNRADEARARYERILAIDPQAPVAANNLAWIYAESGGNLDIALQLAQTARSRLPERAEVADTLGWVYLKKHLATLAAQAFTDAATRDPRNALFQYHLALAYVAARDTASARAAVQRALTIDPAFDHANDARTLLHSLSAEAPGKPSAATPHGGPRP